MSGFAVTITDNQLVPVTRGELSSEITGLSLKTVHPGGDSDLDFTLHRPVTYVPVELYPLGFGFRVDVHDEEGIFWSGRIEKVMSHVSTAGTYYRITARGWGVNLADQIAATQDVAGLQSSAIVANAITNLTQQIDGSNIATSGFTFTSAQPITLAMMTPAQQIAWAVAFGDSNNTQQLYYSYPENDGRRMFTLKPRPSEPDLFCEVSTFELAEFGFDGQFAANRVDLQYSSGGGLTAQFNDTALQGAGPEGWGFIKSVKQVLRELTQPADAAQIGAAQLAISQVLKLTATSLRCRSNTVFRDANGQFIPLHRIRSGMVLQFIDIIPVEGQVGAGLTYANSCLIVGTSYDEDGQTLAITQESFQSRFEYLFGKVFNVLSGEHGVH